MNTSDVNKRQGEEEVIDLNRLWTKVSIKWPWLVFSVIACLILSFLYIRYNTPMYKVTARVMVNDDKKGSGMMGASELLGDLGGLLGEKSTVDNEAEIFKTRLLMEQVVNDMNLNVTYFKKGRVRNVELYKSPFKVLLLKPADTIKKTAVELKPLKDGRISISADELDTVVNFNRVVNLPKVGTFMLSKVEEIPFVYEDYSFVISSVDEKVASLMDDMSVEVANKQITIVDLSINHSVPKRGEDILNEIIKKYVEGNLKDKNEVADSTIKFIHGRLALIGGELSDLEGNIQGFKQKNNLADMTEQSKLLVQNTSEFMNELSKVETQLNILTSLEVYLKDENGHKRVLPSALLPADMVFSGLIEKYNALLLERDRSLLSVTETNPVVVNLDHQIANLRKDMLSNLLTTKNGLTITRDKYRSQMNSTEGQIKQVPATERNYLNLARQQQIKQELYVFLMQKSEETAISKTSTIANSRTIDPPKSQFKPYSPKKPVVLLFGLFVGLLMPVSFIGVSDFLNKKVSSKEDILRITQVPIIGEISHNAEVNNLVVANNSRSAIAEQFRALRTNIAFYLQDPKEKVILLTSSMAGEGKSFVAINLGNILAITGKRVLLMELDLRKPGLSSKLNIPNKTGFTNYVINKDLGVDDIVKPLEFQENLFVVSSGPVPPNPAETLMNERTNALLEELKAQFDYIIIDAPPIGIVTDAQLMEKHADICMYLVRQKFTLKNQLNIVEDLYVNKRMKKIGIVVNDIHTNDGYDYGYGYGYEYGVYNEKKKNLFNKFLK
ncbi:capsular biosynthesis protein [Pedobacter sp. HMWF019]|uniref:GumC family protein n=1 Tax=Pedobacter sp. HMWF019 TaxID=2056856 RepID=UPI000D378294|nr:tyrosine-protein kinase [Pedobacter sp. HMWF019]PTS95789.1 capsular biosynthesis protein [Pedobacter sp. HMWF019]